MNEKKIGKNYLHTHPMKENEVNLDDGHVIVDRKELEEVQQFFIDNQELVDYIGKGKIEGIPTSNVKTTIEDVKYFEDKRNVCLERFNEAVKLGEIERIERCYRALVKIQKQLRLMEDALIINRVIGNIKLKE